MNRWLRFVCSVLAVTGTCLPAIAGDAPTPAGPKAGNVTALLPTAHLSRTVNKANVTKDAAKGDDVYWQDVIRTEKGGRARITLTDQSILSVGSQAELHIIKHDAKTQQTQLELTYGKIRAEVTTVTKDGGGFEVKTPTAVAGVIGTVFGTDSSPIETKFLCVSGLVTIRSADPSISGTTNCEAGKVVIVGHSKIPVKRNATPEEYQKWFADTEPATITGMYPWSGLPGATVIAKATGIRLDGITSVSSPDPAVAPSLQGTTTTTTANLKIAISDSAKPGAYALTFKKSDGSQSTAIFLVMSSPGTSDEVDSLLTGYLETIDEEAHAAVGAINSVQLQVQQAADIANGQLATANATAKPPQDLTKAGSDIQNQAGQIAVNVSNAATEATAAGEAAKKDFTNRFNSAVTALKSRSSSGKPDDEFRAAISSAFSDVESTLDKTVSGLLDTLNSEAATLEAAITSLENTEMAAITSATPGGSLPGQTVEQGFVANFAAGGPLGTGGPLNWAVCDAAYKPASLGVPIPASSPGCTALPGYSSATAALAVNSCDLKPAIYAVRLTNGGTAWETSLRVIAPAYDDPITRLQGLALAYSARTPDIFMEYFDPVNFPGYTELQENIRRTMEQLSSMNIHIIVDDISVNCNEATVRAEWQENYSFLVAPDHIQHLSPQQMTVKFIRTPGKGWYITELNGDNGTVQGLPPGPVLTDTPTPQLSVLNVNVVAVIGAPPVRLAAGGSASTIPPIIVPLGPVKFTATISNTGRADVTLPLAVQFFLIDSKGNTLETINTTLPPPLKAGKTGTIDGVLTIPTTTPGGALLKVGVRVNPGCVIPAQYCDASNLTTVQVQVGAVDLSVAAITAGAPLIGTLPGTVNVRIDNIGKQASAATSGNLLLTSPLFSGSIKANIPAIPAGGFANVSFPVPALPNVSGNENFTATINPAPTGDIDTKDKTLTSALSVAAAVDIQVANIVNATRLVEGQPEVMNITLKNLGATTSSATTNNLILTGASGPALGTANIPAIPAGGTVVVPLSIVLPTLAGNTTFTASISPAVPNDIDSANDTLTKTFGLAAAVDMQVVSIAATGTLIEGQPGTISVTLKNNGAVTSAATIGNLTLSSPSGTLVTGNIPAVPAGGTTVVPFGTTMPVAVGATNFTASISPAVPLDLNPSNDTLTQSLSLATAVDIQVVSITDGAVLVEKTATTFTVTLRNNGLVASTATTNNLTISGPGGPLGTASIPSIGAGASIALPITVTLPAITGANTFTATISPAVPLDLNPSNDTLSASFNIVSTFVDLKMAAFSLRQTTGLLSGNSYGFSVTIQNNGNLASAATDTLSCVATGPNFSGSVNLPLATGTVGTALAPGGSTTLADTFTLPANLAGADTFTCTVGGDPNESSGTLGDNSLSAAATVSYNLNLLFTGTLTPPAALQMGSSSTMSVTVKNAGPDNAPANYTLQPAMNGSNAGAAIAGVALNSGASNTFSVPFTVPQIGTAPQDVSGISGSVTIVDGTGLTETNTTDNVITATTFRLLDFELLTPKSTISAVQGRTLTTNAYTILPSTYLGLFPGMTISVGGTVPTGITIAKSGAVTGTVTIGPGSYGSNYSGVSNGVTHGSTGNTIIAVASEITLTQATIPSILQDGSAVALAGTIGGGVPNITVTLPTSFPTGVTATGTSPVTVADGTAVSYNVSAVATSALGAGSFNLTATDAGISNALETVPAGNVVLKANYTIGGQPAFKITKVTFVNHTLGATFTGANALQIGEAAQMQVTVSNVGDSNPAGGSTITLNAACLTPAGAPCGVTGSATGAAPTTATPTVLTFSVGKVSDAAASGYTGTVTLTTAVQQLYTTYNTASVTFDEADFTVVEGAGWPATQNMPLGKTSQINFNLTVTGTPAFAIPITVSAGQSGVTLPATANFAPSATDYTASIVVGAGVAQVGDTVTFSGSRFGVMHSFSQPVQYFTASVISTTLFVNSATQPLNLPLNNATGESLELEMKGTFITPSGSSGATITPSNTNAPIITFTCGVANAMPGDTFGAQAYDGSTTALSGSKALQVIAGIPATIPQYNVAYNLYVSTIGTSNLVITSIAPSAGVTINTNLPWLAGETLNFDVTIMNNGTAASKGGEELDFFFLNSNTGTIEIASTTVTSPIAAGATAPIQTVALSAPDGNLYLQSSINGTVFQDPPNNAKNTYNLGGLDTSDWSIVITAPGNTNTTPMTFAYDPLNAGNFDATANYTLTINSYAGGTFRSTPAITKGIVDPSITQLTTQTGAAGTVRETVNNLGNTVAGLYIGQLTAKIGNVSRQATVYSQLTSGSAQQQVTLVSTANNVASVVSGVAPPSSVVINGYVTETIGLTGNRSSGSNCATGQTECYFTMTFTPDQTATGTGSNGEGSSNLNYGTQTPFQFTGTLNPATFTLTPGNGTVTASITSAQVASAKKGGVKMDTNPTAIGSQQWDVAFIVNDLDVTFPACVSVAPGANLVVPLTWTPIGSYNAPSVAYAWVDGNLNPVPTTQINPSSGTVSPSGSLNFTVSNSATGTLPSGVTYYLQLTLFNSQGQPGIAPKYFAVGFDLTAAGGYCGASSPTQIITAAHRAGANPKGTTTTAPSNPPTHLAGVYGREHIGALTTKAHKANGPLPDVQIASSSVSFTPSLPKNGDTVEVRFRMNNAGAVDAKGVPMAFVVNGATVVSDTFDVKAGASSLGALHWKIGDPAPKPAAQTAAQIAVDPQHTMPQQSTLNKTAALTHFNLQGANSAAAITVATAGKTAHLQVSEAGCLGFRFASGTGAGCGSADLELSVEDLANGKYVLNGRSGVADLGVGRTDLANASFSSQAPVVVGHTYAVQLSDKSIGLFTVQRVNNPKQLSEKSDRTFSHTNAVKLGKTNGAVQPGDISGGAAKHSEAFVYFDVTYSTQPGL